MGFRNLTVTEQTFKREPVGFRVSVLYCECSDSPYEPFSLPVVFPTKERATRMLARIKAGGGFMGINLRHWVPAHSWDGVYSAI